MLLAPSAQRGGAGPERAPFARQRVPGGGGVLLINPPLEHPVLLERLEPQRQRIRTDGRQGLLEVLEFARTMQQKLAQDEDRPALADDLERSVDRPLLVVFQ